MPICRVPNWGRPTIARSLCNAHYQRWKESGDLRESVPVRIQTVMRAPLNERFWAKVNKLPGEDACWIWTAAVNEDGYGHIGVNYRTKHATHVAWFLETGKWPEKQVLHSCDNPRCVRFSHFFEGTQQDNIADMKRKGRARNGIDAGWRHPGRKLSAAQVSEIRALNASGEFRQHELASRFGVSRDYINRLVNGHRRRP